MKPDWKDAPSWAQWLAQDQSGAWYWYETEPYAGTSTWNYSQGRADWVDTPGWNETLEKRP